MQRAKRFLEELLAVDIVNRKHGNRVDRREIWPPIASGNTSAAFKD